MLAYRTPADAPKWKRRALYSPLARIVIFALLAAAILFLMSLGVAALGLDQKSAPVMARRISYFLRQLVPFLGAYLFLVYVIEKRRPVEIAWRKVIPDGAIGLAAGLLFISSVVAVLWLVGSYVVTGTNPEVEWVRPLLLAGLGTAIAEEIVFRGVLFRITEEGLGTWPAVLVSALFFGGVHIMNPGATVWSSVAIAIEAGALLGLAYHVTRSLPLVMGIHMAWNFSQGTLFGIPVSGNGEKGFLVSTRPGPDWLSGGSFGAEASVVAVLISVIASAALIAYARRHGTIFVRGKQSAPIMETVPS
ncbi:CPBP family intramembrane glutamic endopeptidase [Caenimonas aquaedulcis]|uniref:CPBP family intramembrane metalloprotease n=1 Tax=Caenimonas aquaedulcis TaxID=2793270 RepID=A0A931H6C9_9BURK|nr:CPBP family intramembrane glutamic endopeptidase [Caenimonas aquaedulcis]MBG9389499.1 CPBP family intramembrane metalloprotease [Caenimonas aquaedulcis]